MEFIPENGTVLCEQAVSANETADAGPIAYKRENLPLYRVVKCSPEVSGYAPGDVILCNSTGTRIGSGGKGLYIFRDENIAGKLAG